jgi:hypothetical protein
MARGVLIGAPMKQRARVLLFVAALDTTAALVGCTSSSSEVSDAGTAPYDAADCDPKEAGAVMILCDAAPPESVGCADPGPFAMSAPPIRSDAGADSAVFPENCELRVTAKGNCPLGVPERCCALSCFCTRAVGASDAGLAWVCPL